MTTIQTRSQSRHSFNSFWSMNIWFKQKCNSRFSTIERVRWPVCMCCLHCWQCAVCHAFWINFGYKCNLETIITAVFPKCNLNNHSILSSGWDKTHLKSKLHKMWLNYRMHDGRGCFTEQILNCAKIDMNSKMKNLFYVCI